MQNQIFIFRTSIKNKQDIKRIKTLFTQYPTIHKWNVDLEDWEKILRIECLEITPIDVLNALQTINIYAEELEKLSFKPNFSHCINIKLKRR